MGRSRVARAERALLGGLLLAGTPGCAGSPPRAEDPIGALVRAEDLVAEGDAAGAARHLGSVREQDFRGDYLERFKLAQAGVLELEGRRWRAFRALRDFVRDHPFSPHLVQARETIFRLGMALLESDRGFLFFSSDRDDGLAILEHFYTQFPQDKRLMPDVLQALGEDAFRRREWNRAIHRYQQLAREYGEPRHEWVDLALFRSAMAHFHRIRSWDYDMELLTQAHNELKGYLATEPANPVFREEASKALSQVADWLATKEMSIASFYRRIGRDAGFRHHLHKAATLYPDTREGRRAAELLEELESERDA